MPPKRKILVCPEQKQMIPDYKPDDLSLTEAEYIFASVIEWYKTKGQEIPENDIEWCKEYIRIEREEKVVEEASAKPEKPSSDSYWKDYWAKKKAAGYVTKKELAAKDKKKD